jgi:hypothetical protein
LLGKPYHQSQLLAQIGEALKFGTLNTRDSAG